MSRLILLQVFILLSILYYSEIKSSRPWWWCYPTPSEGWGRGETFLEDVEDWPNFLMRKAIATF